MKQMMRYCNYLLCSFSHDPDYFHMIPQGCFYSLAFTNSKSKDVEHDYDRWEIWFNGQERVNEIKGMGCMTILRDVVLII